jgi:hypothetical protein
MFMLGTSWTRGVILRISEKSYINTRKRFALHVREMDLGYSSIGYILYQAFKIAQERS